MELLRDALEAAEPLALVTVIATGGSTPRHPGARMLVDRDGRSRGTIGGGRVELEACRAGAEVAGGGAARRVRHHLVRDLAMCCGGSMELYVEAVAPSRAALAEAVALRRERRAGTMIHDLRGGPIAVVAGEPTAARPVVEGDRFLDPLRPVDRAVLFGAGHVALALAPVLIGLGHEVVLCDDGDTGALELAPPFPCIVVESFELIDVERAVGPLAAGDHVLIVTRDHAIDLRVVEACVARGELSYLGLIGSRRKVESFRRRLEQKGVGEAAWARVSAPIGLDLGAETPAEIAIAVAAELVARRRGRSPVRIAAAKAEPVEAER